MREELGVPVEPADDVEEAVKEADIVVAATWSREPFLFAGMVGAGAHVSTLGPDEPGKVEVDAGLLREALFVCDDRELAVEMGAAGGAGLGPEAVDAELGEVIGGVHEGRRTPEQITVYGGVGLGVRSRDEVVG
jgi:ornithine cyclodeaminase